MTERITLRAKSDGTEISGELVGEHGAGWTIRLATGVRANDFYDTQWDRVYALPSKPGTVFRARVRGVENVRVMVDHEGDFLTAVVIDGETYHCDKHIDASTVRIELEGIDE